MLKIAIGRIFRKLRCNQHLVILISATILVFLNVSFRLIQASGQNANEISEELSSASNKLNSGEQDATPHFGNKPPVSRLLILTAISDSDRDDFKRFNSSIEAFNLDLAVVLVPSGNPPRGETTTSGEAGFELIKKALSTYKNEHDLVIMLVMDSFNLILNGNKKDILTRFDQKFNPKTRIVFAAESECWPDASLESKYPPTGGGDRFLNSAVLIGYAPSLWELSSTLTNIEAKGEVDFGSSSKLSARDLYTQNQLLYTKAYLDEEIRQKLAIELDLKAELFQSLHSIESEAEIEINLDGVNLKNLAYHTQPVVVHGKGASKVVLNSLGNYLGKAWTLSDGCRYCNESMISLASTKEHELPIVLIGLFIEEPTPFLVDFFSSTYQLNYPHNRIHLFVHNSINYHDKQVDNFLNKYGSQYASQQVLKSYDVQIMPEWRARNYALDKCKQIKCQYYLSLDSVVRLDYVDTLRALIEVNKTIVAPLLSRPKKLWSTFWGSITADGYYARSHDYVSLVTRDRQGLWNVPHIMYAYLIDGQFIGKTLAGIDKDSNLNSKLTYYDSNSILKPVLAFTHHLRASNVFQYLLNTQEFGHLVDPTSYDTSKTHPDFYQLKDNMDDWERHYLHEKFLQFLDQPDDDRPDNNGTSAATAETTTFEMEQPCQDVFWFPLVSELFCQQLIDIMEYFGQWSGGTNDDPRIEGGYESVPTRDIHMKQVGLHEMWLLFLHEYVMPVQLKEYIGYEHDPPRAELAFVVRYHPAEQAFLRPHHDSSTYTINIALNSPQTDYEGGGCRFVRYNCSVIESRKGWALIHPGRLTHYHEGLPVTKGTRYIMVTFVDP